MSQVTQSLEVQAGGGPVSSQSLNKGEKRFTHVHVDETAQGGGGPLTKRKGPGLKGREHNSATPN